MSNCYATPLTFGSNTLESADKAQSTIYMTLLNYSIQRRSPHGSIVRFKVSGVCWHQVFPEPGDIKIFVENRDSQFARHKEICFAVKYGFTALHFYSFKIMFFRNSLDVRNEKILWCITVPPLWTHGSLFLAPGRGRKCCQSRSSSLPRRDECWERTWDETQDSPFHLLCRSPSQLPSHLQSLAQPGL